MLPVTGVKVQLEADYFSSYYLNQRNTAAYERPVIYNLRAAWQVNESVELWGHALNLFDTKYADRVSASNAAVPVLSYSEGYHPLIVRTGVSMKW